MLSKNRHKVRIGKVVAAKTDYKEGLYTQHAQNTKDLVSEEVRLQLLTILMSTEVKA